MCNYNLVNEQEVHMFENLDYMISQERRRDQLRRAETARIIRSVEMPRRRAAQRSNLGKWILTFFRRIKAFGDTVGSFFSPGHHGLRS